MTTLGWDHAKHVLNTIGQLGLKDGAQFTLLCQCMSPVAMAIKDGRIRSQGDLKELLMGETKSAKEPKQYLRAIFEDEKLVLRPTEGKRTIKGAADLFGTDIYLHDGFADLKDEVVVMGEMEFAMSELVQNGKLAEFLPQGKVFGHEEQVLVFVETHRNRLRKNGCATFLPFMKAGKVFVAHVSVLDVGSLAVHVVALPYDSVWSVKNLHRVAFPQLALKP